MPTKTLNGSQGALTLHVQGKWAQLVNFLIITGVSLCSISGLIYPIPEGTRANLDCRLLLDVSSNKRHAKSVNNSKPGIADLIAWCAKQQIVIPETHVIMEGTGVYHELAALYLVEAGATVSILNPAQVKNFGCGLGTSAPYILILNLEKVRIPD